MSTSKKITLNAAGTEATVADAEVMDIVTTVVSSDTVVTGAYGLIQRAGLMVAGAALASKYQTGSFNFLSKAG